MQTSPAPTTPTSIVSSRLRRFACMMYEAVLLFGVIFLASYLFDTLTQSRDALMLRHGRQAIVFLAVGVYFIMCWRKRGQTLPMKTWNIRLIDRNGLSPTLGRLIVRYVLLWPLPLLASLLVLLASRMTGYSSTDLLIVFAPFSIFVWTWFDPEQQFLHDRLLGTRLIDVQKARQSV
ncbi:RDD family protein [Pollutimonas nitritireducens]|uniref:RDD family protein n=1 Tax=Pollutimonas nitritireducens TaxID=2045209 RepID=A0A2N4UFM2_9BURK|nr:RDD family protein [Pollutimonas nitritireducens]PLC53795.1 RDD family protein [Pollutimonas nitritireducens]